MFPAWLAPAGLLLLGFLLAAAAGAGCAPERPRRPAIVGHRGASARAPENTLASFRLAWKLGADAIEGDFRLTADGEVVCLHDRDAERTGGRKLEVARSTLAELRDLEYGSWKGPGWAGEPLPTLAEVLATVPVHGRLLIELKTGPEILPALRRTVTASGLRPEQVAIIAFDAEAITGARRELPEHRAYWITDFEQKDGRWEPSAAEVLATLERCGAHGLDCQAVPEALSPELLDGLRQRGLELHCWTVDDPALARRLIELGVLSLTTNRPDELRAALGG